jgi:hypothetical protein
MTNKEFYTGVPLQVGHYAPNSIVGIAAIPHEKKLL